MKSELTPDGDEMISEVTQARLADLKARLAAVAAEIEARRELALRLSSEIEATELTLAENEQSEAPTIPLRHKVQVEARALALLRSAGPQGEEQMAGALGIDNKPLHDWALRALRPPNAKIRRNGSGMLEAIS